MTEMQRTAQPEATPAEDLARGPRPTEPEDQEFGVVARTQAQLVRRRFFRHRGALIGMAVLLFIIVLSFTSIGFGPIPGWWDQNYRDTGTVIDRGRPTLDVLPPFIDGDGVQLGERPLGQDNVGRDYFALTMRGAQQSLIIAFTVGIVSTFVGVLFGALSGYFRGWVESVLMRITDLVIAIPLLIIAAVLGRQFGGQGVVFLGIALGLLSWPVLARLVRGEFLSLREKEFVEAARAMGATGPRIITRHILPNTLGTIVVNATLTISAAILLETALSFLGLGVQAPNTSLGLLISEYQEAFQTRPWLFWYPGILIIAIALSVNFIGDGLRDAFDPKQTKVRA